MWLKIKPSDDGLNLSWGDADTPNEADYDIGVGLLTAASDQVRERLKELVLAEHGSGRSIALKRLAKAGSNLYYALFKAVRPEESHKPLIIKTWMTEQLAFGDRRLRIIGHAKHHVPWGLVFEGNVAAIPPNADKLEDLIGFWGLGFWGLKYQLTCMLNGYSPPRPKLVRKMEKSKLLSLMHRYIASDAYENFNDEMKAAYTALTARPVGVAHDLTECEELIDKAVSYDTIFHFFGHQSAGILDLGDDQINLFDFSRILDRLTDPVEGAQSYSLLMLSACDSAGGSMDYSFVSAGDRPGFCGVIGTESVVPRDFAALFAIRFLTLMLGQGKSIGEAMSEVRVQADLWPLSLVYGCYAHLDYRINPEVREAG